MWYMVCRMWGMRRGEKPKDLQEAHLTYDIRHSTYDSVYLCKVTSLTIHNLRSLGSVRRLYLLPALMAFPLPQNPGVSQGHPPPMPLIRVEVGNGELHSSVELQLLLDDSERPFRCFAGDCPVEDVIGNTLNGVRKFRCGDCFLHFRHFVDGVSPVRTS